MGEERRDDWDGRSERKMGEEYKGGRGEEKSIVYNNII
jgi:hypothetical protein